MRMNHTVNTLIDECNVGRRNNSPTAKMFLHFALHSPTSARSTVGRGAGRGLGVGGCGLQWGQPSHV